ncbi:unnamed protein product [Lampetra fluviatilis]
MLPVEQSAVEGMSALQPPGVGCQPRSTHLADLLSAAAALVAEMVMDEAEGEMAPWGEQEANPPATAKFRARETAGPLARTWAPSCKRGKRPLICRWSGKPLLPNLMV